MDIYKDVLSAFNDLLTSGNLFVVKLVAFLWMVEKVLEVWAHITPWKWDDNIGVILAKLLQRIGGKK